MSVIDADFGILRAAHEALSMALAELSGLSSATNTLIATGYSTAPSLAAAFAEHASFMTGQAGSAMVNHKQMSRDIEFLRKNLGFQMRALEAQETANKHLFDSPWEIGERSFGYSFAQRTLQGAVPLAFAGSFSGTEASMPLEALLTAYSLGDDAAHRAASLWRALSTQLESSAAELYSAAGQLSLERGLMFDMARNAIEQVRRSIEIFASNAELMAMSVEQFPNVRAANIAELRAIQASTLAIEDISAQRAAQASAIAAWATSFLPASLNAVRPPVVQFTTPVTAGAAPDIPIYTPSTLSSSSPLLGQSGIQNVQSPRGMSTAGKIWQSNEGGLGQRAHIAATNSDVTQTLVHAASTPTHTADNARTLAEGVRSASSAPTAYSQSGSVSGVQGITQGVVNELNKPQGLAHPTSTGATPAVNTSHSSSQFAQGLSTKAGEQALQHKAKGIPSPSTGTLNAPTQVSSTATQPPVTSSAPNTQASSPSVKVPSLPSISQHDRVIPFAQTQIGHTTSEPSRRAIAGHTTPALFTKTELGREQRGSTLPQRFAQSLSQRLTQPLNQKSLGAGFPHGAGSPQSSSISSLGSASSGSSGYTSGGHMYSGHPGKGAGKATEKTGGKPKGKVRAMAFSKDFFSKEFLYGDGKTQRKPRVKAVISAKNKRRKAKRLSA